MLWIAPYSRILRRMVSALGVSSCRPYSVVVAARLGTRLTLFDLLGRYEHA
jgi:hypothetical protein